jgi:DNA-binding response OmpR family regulator
VGIEYALKKEGFNVKVARNTKTGYAEFEKGNYSLILMDVMLPDGNGYELCKVIRKTSEIPIVFLTACDEEVNVVFGLDMGGDDYITKPFRVKELISRIRAALRRAPKKDIGLNQLMRSGNITLYPLETKVYLKDEEISLTTVEYRLLSSFIQNPMVTLSRETIFEKLWDIEGEFVDDNTLSVYIRRLREKIEEVPSKPEYIVTIRGIGYKWNQKSS